MYRWLPALVLATAATAQTPIEPPPDAALGKKIFESQCAVCHGLTGTGGRGPGLNRPKLSKAATDEELRKLISSGIPPDMPGAWQLNPREVSSVALHVRALGAIPPEALPGNPDRGARLYASKGCATCHIAAGQGEGFGPELTEIGARRNAAYLRETLIKPSASLPEGFLYVEAVTIAGKTIRGIRVNEDVFTIQLKDADRRFHSFRKADLKQVRRLPNETPMPSYERTLTAAGLDDMVAYLASLRAKP